MRPRGDLPKRELAVVLWGEKNGLILQSQNLVIDSCWANRSEMLRSGIRQSIMIREERIWDAKKGKMMTRREERKDKRMKRMRARLRGGREKRKSSCFLGKDECL